MSSSLTRWASPADLLRDRMNRLFDDAFGESFPFGTASDALSTREWAPPVDIRENTDSLILVAEIPGISRDDIQITLENNILTLSGERRFEKEGEGESYHRLERVYGKFARSFTLPANVDVSRVDASFKDGLLTITLSKQEEARPRKIEIR